MVIPLQPGYYAANEDENILLKYFSIYFFLPFLFNIFII